MLQELTGPLSRSGEVAEIGRRLSASHVGVPPGPGDARMSVTRNNLL